MNLIHTEITPAADFPLYYKDTTHSLLRRMGKSSFLYIYVNIMIIVDFDALNSGLTLLMDKGDWFQGAPKVSDRITHGSRGL